MGRKSTFKNIDVFVLCGGRGTRLRSVISDKPKILADIGGKPFIEILLDNLALHGFRRIILGVGHLKEEIINYFQANPRKDLQIEFSSEEAPLGTGGAVKKAKPLIKSNHFLAMNGDCFSPVDFRRFYETHLARKTLLSMVLTKTPDVSDYGKVELDGSGKIINFNEKKISQKSALINAGIYLMRKDIFDFLPKKNRFSLEYDFFPKIILNNRCYGFMVESEYIDIGTPEKYLEAAKLFLK